MDVTQQLEKYEKELEILSVTWRWGETRRFHRNIRKIERRNWLIKKIAALRLKLKNPCSDQPECQIKK